MNIKFIEIKPKHARQLEQLAKDLKGESVDTELEFPNSNRGMRQMEDYYHEED